MSEALFLWAGRRASLVQRMALIWFIWRWYQLNEHWVEWGGTWVATGAAVLKGVVVTDEVTGEVAGGV